MSITWAVFRASPHFADLTLECPLTGAHIDAVSFAEQYAATLVTLDGDDRDSWVDVYFTQSPLTCTHFEYVSSRARADFIEMCQLDGCMNELAIINEGWADKAEKERHRKEEQRVRQQQQQQKQSLDEGAKRAKMIAALQNSIANASPAQHAKIDRMKSTLARLLAE